MKPAVQIREIHTKTVTRHFSHEQLLNILANIAADEANLPKGTEGVTVKLTFEGETASGTFGSPPCKTGTCAIVTIQTDLIERRCILEEKRHQAAENAEVSDV